MNNEQWMYVFDSKMLNPRYLMCNIGYFFDNC